MLPRSNAFWRAACALTLFGAFYLGAGGKPSFAGNLIYTGVNLSGAEFGMGSLPGTYGSSYTYPTSQEVDYYAKKGMNTFRLPFRWERMQRTPNGALDATELSRMDTFVNYATGKGNYVLIDPHNFERYYPLNTNLQSSNEGLVGGSTADYQSYYNGLTGGAIVPMSNPPVGNRVGDVPITNAMFADFWGKMAAHYAGNSHVIFDLMNEPNTVSASQVVASDNAAIAAIRNAGANNLIMLEGTSYTGAWTWTTGSGNNTAFLPANIVDPANNWAIEVHQYFDSDGSGTHSTINGNDATTGVQRLTAFTNWARQNNVKAFLGEFAVANSITTASKTDTTTLGNATIVNTLNYLNANSDVWTGWNWWGGGPWWAGSSGNPGGTPYMFLPEPSNLTNPTDRNVMYPLSRFLPQAGDINNDGHVDATDIALMQAALSDLNGWYASMTSLGLTQTQENLMVDVNKDGVVNNADLQKLLGILASGGGSESVPEPASVVLLGLAVLMWPAIKRVRR